MSRSVRVVVLALFALLAALVVTPPAQATSALLGPVLWPLPSYGSDGGTGAGQSLEYAALSLCNGRLRPVDAHHASDAEHRRISNICTVIKIFSVKAV